MSAADDSPVEGEHGPETTVPGGGTVHPLREVAGAYDDPTDGQQYTLPRGAAMGPRSEPITIPEDNMGDGKQFDFNDPAVVDSFEEKVIATQIPGYDLMRLRCLQIGAQFVQPRTAVLDLGTSRGKMIRDLIQVADEAGRPDLIDSVTYVGVDTEEKMLESARTAVTHLFTEELGRTQREGDARVVLKQHDLRTGIPEVNGYGEGYSLVTSVLTLQFVPVEFRQRIVRDIYASLCPGGAFVLVEKVIGSSYVTDDLLVRAYHDHKRRAGISESAIRNKVQAISGFLVPQRHDENIHLLRQAGFSEYRIDTFWRDLQFEAVVAIKD